MWTDISPKGQKMTDDKGANEVDPVADLSDEELEEASGATGNNSYCSTRSCLG
jgi:hypothetical protein